MRHLQSLAAHADLKDILVTSESAQRRRDLRRKSEARVVRLQMNDRMGNPKWVTADLLDVSEAGISISVLTPLAVGAKIMIRGKFGNAQSEVATAAKVRWCTEKINGNLHAGLEFSDRETTPSDEAQEKTPDELDCYEVMQLSPNADADTVQRVYRILAQRYHPDSIETGNKELFLKLCEAHRILSDPQLRAQYDARYRETKQIHWKIFDRAEAAKGPEAEQRKRQGILELLYAKTAQDPERASMTVFDFEQYLGCPREHLEFALWYLKGKGFVKRGDNGRFSLTIAGSDQVESYGKSGENHGFKLLQPGVSGEEAS
jgi:DnaJ domain/PilZ domain